MNSFQFFKVNPNTSVPFRMSEVEPKILIIFNNKTLCWKQFSWPRPFITEASVCFRRRAALSTAGNCGKFSAVNRSAGVLAKTKGIRSQSDHSSSYSHCYFFILLHMFPSKMDAWKKDGTAHISDPSFNIKTTLWIFRLRHGDFSMDCIIFLFYILYVVIDPRHQKLRWLPCFW